ncbi:hypothetical protein [Cytobacillus horneckiae]|uniref:Uncharacterized protein n=1 Tax=Cytobacillus horneckiae TaxID=549687 RepID=A0A2N0Z9I1_9BACI|nr:hypothetical protein [Cytobacillus horneckiae]PKG26150.1 hypothetical protein CWS20_25390 [Cytobacillus horneckiae]
MKEVRALSVLIRKNNNEHEVQEEFSEHKHELIKFSEEKDLAISKFDIFSKPMQELIYYYKPLDMTEYVTSLRFNETILTFGPIILNVFSLQALERMSMKNIDFIFAFYGENNSMIMKEMTAREYVKLRKRNKIPNLCYFPISLATDEGVAI